MRMNRLLPIMFVATLTLGYLAGYSASPAAVLAGQAAQGTAQPAPQEGALPPGDFSRMSIAPDMGEPYLWSMDDMKKAHAELTARAARNASVRNQRDLFVPFVSRTHSFIMVHRVPLQPGAPALAERHEGASDIYFIAGGSGTVSVGGEIENRRIPRPGEYLGSNKGGKAFKVKTGDIMNIPANMVHAVIPDAPEGVTYVLMKVNTGLYPWSLINGTP